MKTFKEFIKEDAPVNSAGGGAIAGIGVGPNGEPGISPKQHKKYKNKNKKKDKVTRAIIGTI
jgi:hypothetical protein